MKKNTQNKISLFRHIIASIISLFICCISYIQISEMDLDESFVTIRVRAKVDTAQDLILYYSDDANFDGEKFISTNVAPQNDFQNIDFVLPKLNYLRKLRLDFGTDANTIEIESLSFMGYGKPLSFKEEKLKEILLPINDIESISMTDKNVKVSTLDGDPFLYINVDCNSLYHKVSQGTTNLLPKPLDMVVSVNLKTEKSQYVNLYYSDHGNFKDDDFATAYVDANKGFQDIILPIPKLDSLKSLRIDPASDSIKVEIKSISFNSYLKKYELEAKDLIYDLKPMNDIESMVATDSTVVIQTNGKDPYLYLNIDLNTIYNKITQIKFKTVPFIYTLILGILVFFWIICIKSDFFKLTKQNTLINSFIIIITLPLFMMVISSPPVHKKNHEFRTKNPMPELTLKESFDFPDKFEAYFNDNFRFRDEILYYNSLLKTKALHLSPIPRKVVLGKDDWLFLSEDCDPKYDSESDFFTKEELALIKQHLEEQQQFLSNLGSEYYVLIPPSKSTVYKKYLPNNLINKKKDRLDQLINYLSNHSTIKVVDVRNEIFEQRDSVQLYYKGDSHWNAKGGFIAYSKLISTIKKDYSSINPIKKEDVTLKEITTYDGDLSRLLVLQNKWPIKKYHMTNQEMLTADLIPNTNLNRPRQKKDPIIKSLNDPTKPSLVMFRDSYTIPMIPFLSEHFNNSVYLWTYQMNSTVIKQYNPQVVILEIHERAIEELLNPNPKGIIDGL